MIKYILKCKDKHEFESWFSDSNEFDKLKRKNLIRCIICDSKEVNKTIMSPNIFSSSLNTDKDLSKKAELNKVKKDLLKIRKFIEKNFKFVGDRFSEEIRNIYYDKKKVNIYGTTTAKEREELKEEGIELSSIPWVDKEN
jgi:hypothetical protein